MREGGTSPPWLPMLVVPAPPMLPQDCEWCLRFMAPPLTCLSKTSQGAKGRSYRLGDGGPGLAGPQDPPTGGWDFSEWSLCCPLDSGGSAVLKAIQGSVQSTNWQCQSSGIIGVLGTGCRGQQYHFPQSLWPHTQAPLLPLGLMGAAGIQNGKKHNAFGGYPLYPSPNFRCSYMVRASSPR